MCLSVLSQGEGDTGVICALRVRFPCSFTDSFTSGSRYPVLGDSTKCTVIQSFSFISYRGFPFPGP